MFTLTKMINSWYVNNQFRMVTIIGHSGIGKSVYGWKTLLETYPDEVELTSRKKRPYNDIRDYLIFKPTELLDFVEKLRLENRRVKTFMMDDAGVWLPTYEYQNPVVQAAVKFMQVARTVTGSILFTTTSMGNLVRRLRSVDMYVVRVRKDHNTRAARGYAQSVTVHDRTYVRTVWEDRYKPKLDDELYNWYKEVRAGYVDEAKRQMRQALEDDKNGIRRKFSRH